MSCSKRDYFFRARGRVRCWVEDIRNRESFNVFMAHERPNLVVHLARKAMTHLIAEADDDYKVNTFKVGTGGHAPGDPLTPVAPLVTDVDLEDTFFTKAITNYFYQPDPDENEVLFSVAIEANEGNDPGGSPVQYTEAGLFCDNGNLFARQTFPAVVKTDTRRIVFEWTIIY